MHRTFPFFPITFLLLATLLLVGGGARILPVSARPVDLQAGEGAEGGIYLPVVMAQTGVQAPILKWQMGGCFSSWCQTGWYSSPAVMDIDGDGQAEVIAGSYDLVALDGLDGSLEWRAESGSRVWPGVALADLTGDGSVEIITGRGGDTLTVYDAQGNTVWERHPFGAGEIRTLAAADLEGDGQFEIIVGRASGGATRQLSAYEPDGSVRAGWPARRDGEAGYGWGMYNQNVTAGDLDGDGDVEIIGPTDTHYITALDDGGDQLPASPVYDVSNPQGPKVWSQVGVHVDHAVDLRGYANCGEEHRPNFADSAPVMADLDGDGSPEIIVAGNVYNCGTSPYTSLYHMPFIFNLDRTRWTAGGFDWTAIPTPDGQAGPLSEDYNRIETAVPNPAVADLDGDGLQEILFPSYDGRLHAYWLDKSEHGNWPNAVHDPAEGLVRFAGEPVVADLNDDGYAEVIFASWVEKGTGATGRLHILDHLGNALHEVDLPVAHDGDWNGAMAAPTLADIDGDPDLEVVLLTAHSGVVAYDLPGSAAAKVLWGTGRGSYLRSGSK